MAGILGSLLKRVIKVRVQGTINQKLTDSIVDGFRRARFYTPHAVVVVVNSQGGSLPQAKHITQILKNYGERNNVAIYCFAQDECLGSANLILTSGVKAFANDMTMLGEFNYSWGSLWFNKLAQKYNVKVDYIFSGQNKVKFDKFKEINPQSQKWMQNHLFLLEHELRCLVADNRSKHFLRNNLDKTQLEQKIFNNALVTPDDAVKLGLIDGIMNVDEILKTTLSGTSVYELNPKSKLENLRQATKLLGALQ